MSTRVQAVRPGRVRRREHANPPPVSASRQAVERFHTLYESVSDPQERAKVLARFLRSNDAPVEISSGAITSGPLLIGIEVPLFVLETNARAVGRQLWASVPLDPPSDVQSNLPTRSVRKSWSHGVRSEHGGEDRTVEQPATTANDILSAIRDGQDLIRVCDAVIDAEVVEFKPQQAADLVGLLRTFIDRHRASKDARVITAAGAAIRSYIALLPAPQLEEVAGLLGMVEPLPSVLENEVAEMVVRKLTAVPPDRDDPYPNLADQLIPLADGYLNPRLLSRDCFGPAAMNATLASALLRTSRFPEVCTTVERLKVEWFRKQLARRAQRLADALGAKFPADRIESQRQALDRLVQLRVL